MADIRWRCVSDLHLGALGSLLTPVDAGGARVDATRFRAPLTSATLSGTFTIT